MRGAKEKRAQPEGGFFISFEGGEGSGKSTQSAILADRLRSEGYEVLETREPGGSPGGKVLREVLLGGHAADKGPLAEACLLTSARREHVDLVIAPALKAGKVVVCDRFADSTRIYQGYVGGLPMETIDQLEAVATNGVMPAVTIVIDVDREVADRRRKARLSVKDDADDRFEKETEDFHNKVAEGFQWLCYQYPRRCVPIDGNGQPEEIAQAVRNTVRVFGLR